MAEKMAENASAVKLLDKNGNDVPKGKEKCNKCIKSFHIVVIFTVIVASLDLLLTIIAYEVLCLGSDGKCIEILSNRNAIKLRGDIDLESIYKKDGLLESYRDTPMAISSSDGAVTFNLQSRQGRLENKLLVNKSGIFVRGVNLLDVTDPDTLESVFSTLSLEIKVPDGAKSMISKLLSTKRIASPVDDNLTLRSDSTARLLGSEGTRMESNNLYWTADQDIYLKSINGSVILSGKDGVFVDVKYLPIARVDNGSEVVGQYKLCVCMPQGKLFKVPMLTNRKVSCNSINLDAPYNPCL